MPGLQTIGNVCVAVAALIFLLPLPYLLWDYARKHLSDNQWVTPALFILIPLWLLLMAALLCVTASGGFDWLRLGRPALYVLTVAAALALAVVSFVLIGSYIRPGFTPSFIWYPPLFLVNCGTMLLVILSLNPKLNLGFSPQMIRLPWTILAGLCLVVGVGFLGYWFVDTGVGTIGRIIAQQISNGSAAPQKLAKIAALDPQTEFTSLLFLADPNEKREVREAATARLRSHPQFLETLVAELETGYIEPAVGFVSTATLSPAEQTRLAGPARKAMQRWVDGIPAPNYTTKKHLKELRRWG